MRREANSKEPVQLFSELHQAGLAEPKERWRTFEREGHWAILSPPHSASSLALSKALRAALI
jgi:hypothetical protein